MKSSRYLHLASLAVGTFVLTCGGALASPMRFATPLSTQEPDNTANNKQEGQAPTADQQKENAADRELTKKIRSSIMEDKNLSTYAHNVKVIVREGEVTLKGPVKTEDERSAIEAKATAIAGTGKVQNQLTVKQ